MSGSIDLAPLIWWGLAVLAVFVAVLTLVVRLVWRTGQRGKTPEELHRGRCSICMGQLRRGEQLRPTGRGSGWAHMVCPPWPPG